MLQTFSAFLNACDHGDLQAVQALMGIHDMTSSLDEGNTPLMRALKHKRLDVAHLVLKGSDLHQTNMHGDSPLMIALQHLATKSEVPPISNVRGDLDFSMVERLIHGSLLNVQNAAKLTPLMQLIEINLVDLVEQHCFHVPGTSFTTPRAPLVKRVIHKNPLSEREQVWMRRNEASYERVFTTIMSGSDLTVTNGLGHTPLMHAIQNNQPKLVKLLANGSDLHQTDGANMSLLSIALKLLGEAPSPEKAEIVRHLLPLSDLTHVDDFQGLSLHWACLQSDVGIFQEVLEASPPDALSRTTESNSTPLILAARKGHLSMVQAIVDRSNVDHVNDEGLTAFNAAREAGHLNVVQFLHEHEEKLLRTASHEKMVAARPRQRL